MHLVLTPLADRTDSDIDPKQYEVLILLDLANPMNPATFSVRVSGVRESAGQFIRDVYDLLLEPSPLRTIAGSSSGAFAILNANEWRELAVQVRSDVRNHIIGQGRSYALASASIYNLYEV